MKPILRVTLALAAASIVAHRAAAQSIDSVLTILKTDNRWTLSQQKSLCEIPAPPFHEAARGAEYKRRLEALGLRARVDSMGDVIAELPGGGRGPTVVLSGHLDT